MQNLIIVQMQLMHRTYSWHDDGILPEEVIDDFSTEDLEELKSVFFHTKGKMRQRIKEGANQILISVEVKEENECLHEILEQ